MKLKGRTAFVTGGNRGIGFETCRLLAEQGANVLLGSREKENGIRAAEELKKQGSEVQVISVDMADLTSVQLCIKQLHNRVDILINNAAVLDRGSIFDLDDSELEYTIKTDLTGPAVLAKHLALPMKERGWGRIVNASSGMGAISRGLGSESVAYRLSKLGLNGFTVCLADALRGSGVLVNSVDPGWVRTAMGGPMARKTPVEGAKEFMYAVLLPDDGPSGFFFRGGKKVDW
jgi:NAD(P)-dependent dehydrogenase (short-subunit alcohol dehydrogenase family)